MIAISRWVSGQVGAFRHMVRQVEFFFYFCEKYQKNQEVGENLPVFSTFGVTSGRKIYILTVINYQLFIDILFRPLVDNLLWILVFMKNDW